MEAERVAKAMTKIASRSNLGHPCFWCEKYNLDHSKCLEEFKQAIMHLFETRR